MCKSESTVIVQYQLSYEQAPAAQTLRDRGCRNNPFSRDCYSSLSNKQAAARQHNGEDVLYVSLDEGEVNQASRSVWSVTWAI